MSTADEVREEVARVEATSPEQAKKDLIEIVRYLYGKVYPQQKEIIDKIHDYCMVLEIPMMYTDVPGTIDRLIRKHKAYLAGWIRDERTKDPTVTLEQIARWLEE